MRRLNGGCSMTVALVCLHAAAARGDKYDDAREDCLAHGKRFERACEQLVQAWESHPKTAAPESDVVKYAELACDGGRMNMCAIAAEMHAEGKGVARDPAKAADLEWRACSGESMRACKHMGALAVPRLEAACKAGDAGSCRALATMYQTGSGVPADGRRAAQILDESCTRDDLKACMDLGAMLLDGAVVPVDRPRAKALLEKACKAGKTEACMLGHGR